MELWWVEGHSRVHFARTKECEEIEVALYGAWTLLSACRAVMTSRKIISGACTARAPLKAVTFNSVVTFDLVAVLKPLIVCAHSPFIVNDEGRCFIGLRWY